MRRREYHPRAAYASKFTLTLPERVAGGIKAIEGLLWLERGAGKGDAARYLVQIINEPFQIIAFKVWHTAPIFLPVECVVELIGITG